MTSESSSRSSLGKAPKQFCWRPSGRTKRCIDILRRRRARQAGPDAAGGFWAVPTPLSPRPDRRGGVRSEGRVPEEPRVPRRALYWSILPPKPTGGVRWECAAEDDSVPTWGPTGRSRWAWAGSQRELIRGSKVSGMPVGDLPDRQSPQPTIQLISAARPSAKRHDARFTGISAAGGLRPVLSGRVIEAR